MKQYESYKDSGIEWLGKIPSHWTPISMKFYFYMKGRIGWQGLKADEFIEEGPYLVTGTDFENGKVMWERCYHISEERYSEAPEIHVEKGDLLITKDGTVGKLALIDEKPEKVSLNSHLLILRPVKPNIDNHFIYWALQADNFVYYTGLAQNGSIMTSLSQEKIGDYKIALPSFEEQQAIASYLNHKVGQIDSAIAEKEQMLEDLKAYRSAIISEAVTKGLNKDVEMKDSGIEWIGKVPQHWSIVKLSRVYPNIGSGTTPDTNNSQYYSEEGINWLQTGDLNDGDIFETSKHITELALKERGLRIYPKGSLVIALYGATIGKVGLLQIDTTTNQACCVLPPNERMSIIYTKFVLQAAKDVLLQQSVGGGQPNISQSIIRSLSIPMPPLEEQIIIAERIQNTYQNIESTLKELLSGIDDLKAYKSSIITEAVTGKVDLRGWNSNNDKT